MINKITTALADMINVEQRELKIVSQKCEDYTYTIMYYFEFKGRPELYRVTYRIGSNEMIVNTFMITPNDNIDYWVEEE